MSRESISPKLRFDVLKRDAFTCQYCGRSAPEVELHVDHVVPVAEGGGNDPGNLTAACVECNLGKSDSDLADDLHELGHSKSQDEWVERLTVSVRRRIAGARPEPVRGALKEALAWGATPHRLIILTNDATSWVDWLRRIYMLVGALIERDMLQSAIRERWQRVDDSARERVVQAAERAQEQTSETSIPSEVN